MSTALENMHGSNSVHKGTEVVDGIRDVGNESDVTLDIRNLRRAVQDKIYAYNPRITKSEDSSFDPDVAQDLSTKQFHKDTSSERASCHQESVNRTVSTKSNKQNGQKIINHDSELSGRCVENAAQENVQEQSCTLVSDTDACNKRCKDNLNNEKLYNEQKDSGKMIEDARNIESKEGILEAGDKVEHTQGASSLPKTEPDGNNNQENEECVEKKTELNSGDLNKNLPEKQVEAVKEESSLAGSVNNEHAEKNKVSDVMLSKPGLSTDIEKQVFEGGKTLRCPDCPWAFSSKTALQAHITKIHKSKRAMTSSAPDKSNYQNTRSKRATVLYVRPKPFQCTKCQSSFHKRKELKEHSLCHTKQNHLVCHFCGMAFSKRKDLNDHLLYFHDQKQQGAFCELCGKTFSQAGNLKIHLRIHTKEKPYTCEHCGKCYAQSGDLKTHVRVHTDERPYLCEFCGNLFHSLSHLGRHSKVHTKEKPYTCLVCGHSFAHAHHLKKHYRIHTKEKPYNCDTCGKAFARSDYLKQHIRVHTKEKPYICKICGKGFSQGGSLRLHQRVHARQGIM